MASSLESLARMETTESMPATTGYILAKPEAEEAVAAVLEEAMAAAVATLLLENLEEPSRRSPSCSSTMPILACRIATSPG